PPLQPSRAERSLEVDAVGLGGVELVLDARERQLGLARADGPNRSGRDVVRPRDRHPLCPSHGGDTTRALNSARGRRYPRLVATILLCGVDLFFRGKLEALLPGPQFVTTDSVDLPDAVIADIAPVEPHDAPECY